MAVNLFWEAFLPTETELEYFSMCGKQCNVVMEIVSYIAGCNQMSFLNISYCCLILNLWTTS